jgi:hypothetical protein
MTGASTRTPCSNQSALQRAPLIGTKSTADIHQGAQQPRCNTDAVYMAATKITPISIENLLPRRSHPYMVRETNGMGGWPPRRQPAGTTRDISHSTVARSGWTPYL